VHRWICVKTSQGRQDGGAIRLFKSPMWPKARRSPCNRLYQDRRAMTLTTRHVSCGSTSSKEVYYPSHKPVIGSISHWSCIISVPSAGNRETWRRVRQRLIQDGAPTKSRSSKYRKKKAWAVHGEACCSGAAVFQEAHWPTRSNYSQEVCESPQVALIQARQGLLRVDFRNQTVNPQSCQYR
jgi:hypothetical protein